MPCSPLLFLIGHRKRAAANATYDKFPKGVCQRVSIRVATLLSRASGLGCVLLRTCYRQFVALLLRASGLGCVLLRTCYRQLLPFFLAHLDWAVFSSEPVTASMLHSSFAHLDWAVFSSEPVTAGCLHLFTSFPYGLLSQFLTRLFCCPLPASHREMPRS
jgi:hypothetical protein